MSKITTLITALVLGTSSLAAADTGLSFHASASWGSPSMTAPVVRDHRSTTMTYQAPVAPFVRGTWIALAEPMRLGRGRTFIELETRAPLNQIRLQSTWGQAFVSTVIVQYANGASQVETLNQWIDASTPFAQFNLNRTAEVDSILINGSRSHRGGTFQVFGYASSTRPTPPIYQPERPPVYQPPVPPVYQPPVYQPPVVAAPISVPLATNMTLWGSYGNKEVVVDSNARPFSTLRIIGNSGQSPMSHIIVAFTNGHQQVMPINRTIIGGDKLDLTLDGAGRYAIARVTVYHNGTANLVGPSGWFSLAAL